MTTLFFIAVAVLVLFVILRYDRPEIEKKHRDKAEPYRELASHIVNTELRRQRKLRAQRSGTIDHTSVYGGYIAGSSSSSSDYSGSSSSGGCGGGGSSSSGGDGGGCL